MTTKFLDDV